MSYDWGPHYIVPSEAIKDYSERVLLRETFDENLLSKELEERGYRDGPYEVTNPWYCRKKNTDTWIKIGESSDHSSDFAVSWDTKEFDNGEYEILGLMHVSAKKGEKQLTIARQNIVDVKVEN